MNQMDTCHLFIVCVRANNRSRRHKQPFAYAQNKAQCAILVRFEFCKGRGVFQHQLVRLGGFQQRAPLFHG